MITVTVRPGLAINLVGRPGSISQLRNMMASPAGLARVQRLLDQPGVMAVALHGRQLTPIAECARCGALRPMTGRGLCSACRKLCAADGTLDDYGCAKADKMADYALHRNRGLTIGAAARMAGVTERTGARYEAELDAGGRAPWRARDPNALNAARRSHAA